MLQTYLKLPIYTKDIIKKIIAYEIIYYYLTQKDSIKQNRIIDQGK